MKSDITILQCAAAVSPGDPDQRRGNEEPPRRPRHAPQPARTKEPDDLGFDEHDPHDRRRIGLLINVRA